MTIAPRRVRAAKALLSRHRRTLRLQRAPSVRPVAFGQRRPRLKDPEYLAFIRRQPCCVCGNPGPSQAAHVRAGFLEAGWRSTGLGEKPDDRRALPLCAFDHLDGPDAQHRGGEREWWEARGLYPPDLAAAFGEVYGA